MWAIVNVMQVISHLVFVQMPYPENLKTFFSYMVYGNSLLSALPGVPNMFEYVVKETELSKEPMSPLYAERDYSNRNVLLICGPEIQTLILIAIVTPLVKVLSQYIAYFRKFDDKLRYAALIRTVIEGNLKLSVCAFMNAGIVLFSLVNPI